MLDEDLTDGLSHLERELAVMVRVVHGRRWRHERGRSALERREEILLVERKERVNTAEDDATLRGRHDGFLATRPDAAEQVGGRRSGLDVDVYELLQPVHVRALRAAASVSTRTS